MGYINKEFIDRLLDKVILQDVIQDFLKLSRAGANLKGKSPFSDDKTPSLMVSPVKQIWKDFSTGKGGNAIAFLMENNKTYPEAIEYLASKYAMTVEYADPIFAERQKAKIEKKEALRPVLKATHSQYMKKLRELPADHAAKKEIEKRGYDEETIIEWGIGFAPDNFLYDVLKNSGKVREGEDLGLITPQNERANVYDKYSGRLIYPIHDANGLIIGLAGRDITGREKAAKWINPPVNDQNVLYNKSKVWYAMHRARTAIRKKGEAWIVEGYNDAIAWHRYDIANTVAPCGTAIAKEQRNELKKICTRVIFCMDPDAAGVRSTIKYLEEFIADGFRAEVVSLPCDPDDFSREHLEAIKEHGLEKAIELAGTRKDGFKFLLEHHLQGGELDKSTGAKKMAELIAKIEDDTMVEIYTPWIAKDSGVKIASIRKWIKEAKINLVEVVDEHHYGQIELPKGVDLPLSEVEPDIRRYGMFMANNQIYMQIGDSADNKIRFASMSNFMIEVLQHMQDEKFPMKLVRIKNIHGEEKIFDTPSENLNAPQAFDNTMTGHGNFRFDGNLKNLKSLRHYLFDKMGNGRKIDVLGWQPDGKFWAWNNKITTETGADVPMDKHGIFVIGNVYYYLPSANAIYANNSFKFDAQKRFKCIPTKVPFETYAAKVLKVHRDHGISAILFAIASLFQDIVVDKVAKFPILFFYGPGSTGKDELAEIVQSFVGVPQVAINLEGQVSTIKAQVREFAQFRNGISQLSEYKRGNAQLDGMLKSLWDRRGYKRGNIESHVGTDSVPIESSAVLTGNDFPNEEPLILRVIWNEMTKNQFTEAEMNEFDELKDMTSQGVSGYSDTFIKFRPKFEANFDRVQRTKKAMLQDRFPEAKSRMIFNLSILAATHEILKDEISFPFSLNEMLDHFQKGIDQQIRKINAASILNRFWDCFIISLRGNPEDRIQVGKICNVEGSVLYYNWTHTYAKIQRQWWIQYHEVAPSKATIAEQIEKSGAHLESIKVHTFEGGRGGARTSAEAINLDRLSERVKDDIIGSVMFQTQQNTLFPPDQPPSEDIFSSSPATPNENKIIRE